MADEYKSNLSGEFAIAIPNYVEGGWSKHYEGENALPKELLALKEKQALIIGFTLAQKDSPEDFKDAFMKDGTDLNVPQLPSGSDKPVERVAAEAIRPLQFALASSQKDLEGLSKTLAGINLSDEQAVQGALKNLKENGIKDENGKTRKVMALGILLGVTPEEAAAVVVKRSEKNNLTSKEAAAAILISAQEKIIAGIVEDDKVPADVIKKLEALNTPDAPANKKALDKDKIQSGTKQEVLSVAMAESIMEAQQGDATFVSSYQPPAKRGAETAIKSSSMAI